MKLVLLEVGGDCPALLTVNDDSGRSAEEVARVLTASCAREGRRGVTIHSGREAGRAFAATWPQLVHDFAQTHPDMPESSFAAEFLLGFAESVLSQYLEHQGAPTIVEAGDAR